MAESYLSRPSPSGLADVIEIILDRGIVIDAYVRISLLGIELVTVDARVVVASVDTYLRFAEATNRLDLWEKGGETLPDLMSEGAEKVAKVVAADVVERKVDDGIEKAAGFVADKAAGVAAKAVDKAVDKVVDVVTPGDSGGSGGSGDSGDDR